MELNTMNPVDLIAQARLFLLAAGGSEAAGELVKALDFTVDTAAVKEKLVPSMLAENILYSTTLEYIRRTGCRNVLELSCGYSPMGIELAKEGYSYVGADAAEIAETMSFTAKDTVLKYAVIDYASEASLFAAADMLDGPVTIVTQGLTSAMSMNEKLLALEAIGKVLSAHGGTWIMPDLDARKLSQGLRGIIKGKTPAKDRKWKVELDSLGWQDSNESIPALNALKFKAEARPLITDVLDDEIRKQLSQYDTALIDKLLGSVFVGSIEAGDMPLGKNTLDLFTVLKGTELNIKIVGTVDSNTAPELVKQFENADLDGGFTDIAIDCSRLNYISSAGLRALLIMKKAIGDEGMLRLTGTNDVVREILNDTGFAGIMEVE